MDLYAKTAYSLCESLTKSYSTSFSSATRLFQPQVRMHIYGIYGLLRIADEIVDTYKGNDAAELLASLENETKSAIARSYSVNPIVHAFALTAKKYSFGHELIDHFFTSMNVDTAQPKNFTQKQYEDYIIGSAEVVGLMCLKVFVDGNLEDYKKLELGARKLGAAYQKINFLRDFAADYTQLGRIYFPNVASFPLNESQKKVIIADIRSDLTTADMYSDKLPRTIRPAVNLSRQYYGTLLDKLEQTPAATISTTRIRVSSLHKSKLVGEALLSDFGKKVRVS